MIVQFLFHAATFALCVFTCWFESGITGITNTFGGKSKFLTIWNLYFQTGYFAVCTLNDILGTNTVPKDVQKKRSGLQKLRDLFLASVVFPMGTFVVLTFWGIYSIDRELIFPKRLDAFIPGWHNHLLHTTCLPLLLVDMLLCYHHYPSRRAGYTLTLGIAGVYQAWIIFLALYMGFWVYPVLEVLSWPSRTIFFVALWVALIIIYRVGERLNVTFWGKSRELTKKRE